MMPKQDSCQYGSAMFVRTATRWGRTRVIKLWNRCSVVLISVSQTYMKACIRACNKTAMVSRVDRLEMASHALRRLHSQDSGADLRLCIITNPLTEPDQYRKVGKYLQMSFDHTFSRLSGYRSLSRLSLPLFGYLLLSAPTLDQRSSPYSPKPRATPATHCYSRNNAAIPQTLSIAIGFLPARTYGSTNSSHSATGRAHS